MQEWRDSLFLRYGLDTPDIPKYCNRCNANLYICHALYCNKGGIVTTCCNEIRDRVVNLAGRAFTPTHVRYNPLLCAGCVIKRIKSKLVRSKTTPSTPQLETTGDKGDLLIHDLWKNVTDIVHDMIVVKK